MFSVTGQVVNVFTPQDRTDKATGETEASRPKVQLLGAFPLQNGETQFDMVTMSIDDKAAFEKFKGKKIRLPLGVFAQNNKITYFIPKGSVPEIVAQQ
jgi:hypothetical protein